MTRFGGRAVLIPGLVLLAGGLLIFRRTPEHASYLSDLLPAMVLMGVGAGLAFPSLMTLAMSAATPEDSGLASGLVNTTQQVGGALGLAVLATLSTTRTNGLLGHGHTLASSLISGYHLAFTIAAILVVVAIGAAVVVLGPGVPTTAAAEDVQPVAVGEPEPAYMEEAA